MQRTAQHATQRETQQMTRQVNEVYREEVRATCARWRQEEDPWGQLFGK